ncbi:putative salutaridinol 7-O-acetyltransferase [Helianthus annuus]|nr:putative salutaridinol 7-O-acetyltransferase [Helianthus annuus]
MTMIWKLLRLGRRQLHTIISRETIKPSSPTPSHLHTYNLSEMDLINQNSYTPLLLFYPNNGNHFGLTAEQKATILKKSLSQSLTQYYPFAGRFAAPASTYVECNDEGVLFLEARNDGKLDTFQHKSLDDESLEQLFADELVFSKSTSSTNPVAVQLNHFSCGGLGLAVSLSRTIGDGCTLGSFLSYWASVARYGSTAHKKVLSLVEKRLLDAVKMLFKHNLTPREKNS